YCTGFTLNEVLFERAGVSNAGLAGKLDSHRPSVRSACPPEPRGTCCWKPTTAGSKIIWPNIRG
ncbi:MAG TPA: hypothetical protein VNN22_24470, partial [Verrucomicrobiae bacterium]|nr:hypothetical protein [Verrucomicrobiae bacterium]